MKRFIYMLTAMLVIASQALAAAKYKINLLCGEGGTVTVSKMTETASEGEFIRVFIHPDNDLWELDRLTILRMDYGSKIIYDKYYDPNYEAYSFTMPSANVNVYAVFMKTRFAVTVNNTAEGGWAAASTDKGPEKTTVLVTTYPDYGYKATAVQVTEVLFGKSLDVTSVSDNKWQFTLLDDDVTVTPVFEKLPYIEIEKGAHKNGDFTVTDHEYWGETVQIITTPDVGYLVDVVTVSYVPSADGETQSFEATPSEALKGAYTFVMPQCKSVVVSVKFMKADYDVVIDNIIAHGTVTKLTDSQTHHYGDFVTLSVTADKDYVFKRLWITDAEGNDVNFSWQMKGKLLALSMPASNIYVHAQFRTAVFDVEVVASENCTVSAVKTACPGDTVCFTVGSSMGYLVTDLSVEAGYVITGGSVPHAPRRAPGMWHTQSVISVEKTAPLEYCFVVPETLDDELSAGYLDDTKFRIAVSCKDVGPRVIWCEGNKTLYFDYETWPQSEPKAGDTYDGQTITQVWIANDALPQRAYVPRWNNMYTDSVNRVVFTPEFQKVRPKSCYYWFNKYKSLREIQGLEYLNTSEVTSMRAMFQDCWSLETLDLNNFDMTNVTDTYRMFFDCFNLTTIWCNHTWNVQTSNAMFTFCDKLCGAVDYSISNSNDCAMANPVTGYFTAFPTIELKDLEDNSAVLASNLGKKVNVKYNRRFSAIDNGDGTWTSKAYTICLPFDLDLTAEKDAGIVDVCRLYYVQYPSEEEVQMGMGYEFIFSNTVPELEAGQGYLIIVNKGELEIYGDGVIISDEEKFETILRWGYLEEEMGTWRGSLRDRSNQECTENLVYTMSKDGNFRRISNTTERERTAWMPAFRAAFFAKEFKGRNRFDTSFKLWVQGDNSEADPIVDLPADDFAEDSDFSGYIDEEELVGIRETVNGKPSNGKLFDLQGRQLNGRPHGKGIYISNGKKVISK